MTVVEKDNVERKEYIVGLDIGSSNIVMAVGERKEDGEVAVLGVEVQKIESCVKDGDVTNHLLLGDAIIKAKSALENDLGVKLNSAYVGISGRSAYCVRYEDYVEINERSGCVTDFDMKELNTRIDMVVPGGGDQIIDRIPLRYVIDDHQEVQDPLGAYGRKLSVTYLFVLVGRHQIDRVNRALHRAEIKSCGLCVNPTLLADLLLSPDEKEEGVAIVDIGGDLTDISIIREGKLNYFSSLPIGSSSINNDLHEFLKIQKKDIDLIKHKHGSAIASSVPEDTAISVKTAGHAKKSVLQRNIAEIAEERLKDIAQFVMRELKAAKFSTKIPCGVVLTGGATYLSNIDQLFARELNMEVRLGSMLYGLDDNSQEMVCPLPQSAAMALLLYGSKHDACDTREFGASPIEEEEVEPAPTPTPTVTTPPTTAPVTPPTTSPVTPPTAPEVVPPADDTVTPPEDGSNKLPPIEEPPVKPQPEPETKKWWEKVRTWVETRFDDDDQYI